MVDPGGGEVVGPLLERHAVAHREREVVERVGGSHGGRSSRRLNTMET